MRLLDVSWSGVTQASEKLQNVNKLMMRLMKSIAATYVDQPTIKTRRRSLRDFSSRMETENCYQSSGETHFVTYVYKFYFLTWFAIFLLRLKNYF